MRIAAQIKHGLKVLGVVVLTCAPALAQSAMSASDLEAYDQSGRYQAELENKIAGCLQEAKQWQENNFPVENPIAIFDIDETIVSNIGLIRKSGYQFTKNDFVTHVTSNQPSIIQPAFALFNYLKDNGIKVFFITGRTENMCEVTVSQLAAVGINPSDYHSIICTPNSESASWKFKLAMRKQLVAKGHTIVINISDQQMDLVAAESGVTCKLPNPFYEVT